MIDLCIYADQLHAYISYTIDTIYVYTVYGCADKVTNYSYWHVWDQKENLPDFYS